MSKKIVVHASALEFGPNLCNGLYEGHVFESNQLEGPGGCSACEVFHRRPTCEQCLVKIAPPQIGLARKIVKWIADYNYKNQGDSLGLKLGGDGDSGEILVEALEAYFKSNPK